MPRKQSITRRTPATKRPKGGNAGASVSKRRPSGAKTEKSLEETIEEIQRGIERDLNTVDFATLDVGEPKPQKRTAVLLKMEPDVLAFFKAGGKGYQTRINRVLRFYVEDVRRASARSLAGAD